jgi:predicted nuclease of predicted toxin-antitoxin system
MKIKLDENLPVRISPLLQQLGHDVHTVNDEGLGGRTDSEIWAARSATRDF